MFEDWPVEFCNICECDAPSKHRILETNGLREQRHQRMIKLNVIQIEF